MTLLARLRYALYLAAVGSAAIGLLVALASADDIALLPPSAFDAMLSPLFMLVMYGIAFAVSPWCAEHFPITRNGNDSGA